MNSPELIDKYQVIKKLASGGMGDVYIVFDTVLKRQVALKRIQRKLATITRLRKRFLREAHIASLLFHPSIISVYDINDRQDLLFYTMPYVEGLTLREIFTQTLKKRSEGKTNHSVGDSIQSLVRIFLQLCQAISYTHSKGIVHRDIKPGNIIVGKYGQVVIVDWGLACFSGEEEEIDPRFSEISDLDPSLTHPGKVVGTLSYMSPERVHSKINSPSSDIYSLGVILYQMLTLKLPFKRSSMQSFKKAEQPEPFTLPHDRSPQRDIPHELSEITKNCLEPSVSDRYHSVEELISDIQNFLEGKPGWIHVASLDIKDSTNWSFQENIVISKHLAIANFSDSLEWMHLMIAKATLSGNYKINFDVTLSYKSHGIGILFCAPNGKESKSIENGFCLWLGSKRQPGIRLLRSNVEVSGFDDATLPHEKLTKISIEKIEHKLTVWINDEPFITYANHVPLIGNSLGLLCKDFDFDVERFECYSGSQSVMVNCLTIPDSYLSHSEFDKAYEEYVKIAESFYGHIEGREARFRAGITLVEKSLNVDEESRKKWLLHLAESQFEKLSKTSGAPLEYLGRSIVHHHLSELDEEIQTLEFALRKFKKHPVLYMLEDHIIYRMHESARKTRYEAYSFALVSLRLLPHKLHHKETRTLLSNLQKNIVVPEFMQQIPTKSDKDNDILVAITIAFHLNKQNILYLIGTELESNESNQLSIISLLLCLKYLGNKDHVTSLLPKLSEQNQLLIKNSFECNPLSLLQKSTSSAEKNVIAGLHLHSLKIAPFIQSGYTTHKSNLSKVSESAIRILNIGLITRYLMTEKWSKARSILLKYSSELTLPLSDVYPLYICFLAATGEEQEFVNSYEQLFKLAHPPLPSLLAHYLSGNITFESKWYINAFPYEKIMLLSQLYLYGRVRKDIELCDKVCTKAQTILPLYKASKNGTI